MSLNLDPNVGISKYELRLWTKAIKNGYPITDDIRKAMVQKAIAGLATTKDDRAIVRFLDVLVKMDGVNVRREMIDAAEKINQPLTASGVIDTEGIIRAALDKAGYIDHERGRITADSGAAPVVIDAGDSRVERDGRPMGDGSAPGGDGSGRCTCGDADGLLGGQDG